ncbi:hypothetical protein ME121_6324 [Methylobacterium sp. ME121]|jgi:hypothetical protein|nr:hypothetical protein ME121_6324 [Methylobacterium sp. ME121]
MADLHSDSPGVTVMPSLAPIRTAHRRATRSRGLDERRISMTSTKTALLAIGLCLGPAAAFAEQSPAREALKQYCTGDYMDFCSAYAPGGPEVEACFKANLKKLSPNCSAAITAYKKEQRATKRVSEAR